MEKKTALEQLEIKAKMYDVAKEYLRDNNRSIDSLHNFIEELDEKERNGGELDRWDKQNRNEYQIEIEAREELANKLMKILV